MDKKLRHILDDVKQSLARLYGRRLEGVYLFGSFARGEGGAESDVDLLIVLDEVRDYVREIRRTSELISSLALSCGISISRVFASKMEWEESAGPFLSNVRKHAVAA